MKSHRLLAALLPAVSLAEQPFTFHTYEGSAYLPDNGELLYTEEYEVRMQGGKPLDARTTYRDPSGESIAVRSLDFSENPWAPDYRFEDYRTGRVEGAEYRDGEMRAYTRPTHEAPMREETLRVPHPAVVDGGFTRFALDHWEQLMAGERFEFHFVAVARLDWFAFEILAEPATRDSGDSTRVLLIQATNPLLRMVVPPIYATFDVATREMREYRGRSNIRDGKPVRLVYAALAKREN